MFITVVVLLSLLSVPNSTSQAPDPNARAAALRFAIENGLQIPSRDRAIVLVEGDLFALDSPPASGTPSERQAAAKSIGKQIGSSRTGRVTEVLRCVQSRCVPFGRDSVVSVSDPETSEAGTTVLIMVFSPADKPAETVGIQTITIVRVEEREGGWVGTLTTFGPKTVPVSLARKK